QIKAHEGQTVIDPFRILELTIRSALAQLRPAFQWRVAQDVDLTRQELFHHDRLIGNIADDKAGWYYRLDILVIGGQADLLARIEGSEVEHAAGDCGSQIIFKLVNGREVAAGQFLEDML